MLTAFGKAESSDTTPFGQMMLLMLCIAGEAQVQPSIESTGL